MGLTIAVYSHWTILGEKPHFLPVAFLQAKRSMAALRERSRLLFVQWSFLSKMTPKYFCLGLGAFCVVLGELDLVSYTSL